MFKTILFPVDQSRETREAAETVINLVKTYDSRLILLSVVEKTPDGQGISQGGIMTSTEAVAQLLQGAQALFADQGIEAEIIEKEGKPPFIICDVADEKNADLIIMGSRGLGLTSEGASESVTHLVINLAPCPILIIP
ncbi:unknown [Crocosphaera subtropica ATCC 51142]|uniref:UspA domain-containing protein n=1 Tax=Crocosphaera subtropica (strain ATCC 51142 / BH68) TaxID=43989 RepID=B1WSI9_CROS5|nr:universal stress protein [Crocosphaera subtropica]ACB53568.1 unknown [Crocosphaera subtropica ATCC 51142]